MQREALSILGLFDLFVLWNVGYNATDNHSRSGRPADQVSHSKAQFIVNDPVHCDALRLLNKRDEIPLDTLYSQFVLLTAASHTISTQFSPLWTR